MRTEQRDINRRENGEIIRSAAWFRRDDTMHNAVYDPNAAGCMSVGLFHRKKQTDRTEYSAALVGER